MTQGITVTKTLAIPANYQGEIHSDGQTLTLASGVDNIFTVAGGATVTFDHIIFDGKQHGRILDAGQATVTIKNSTLKNATTENFQPNMVSGENTQRYEGGAIYASYATLNLENTIFEGNHTKSVVPLQNAPLAAIRFYRGYSRREKEKNKGITLY